MTEHLIIVGGGQAAAQAVASLRQANYSGAITLVADEPWVPYQRPPLSKKYLAGELPGERLHLRPASFYEERNVTLLLGARAVELELAARRVRLADGRTLAYDRLLLATGSRPRRLARPGAVLAGIHTLRTIADVDAIRAEWAPGSKLVMVGAGYIGLEVAAVAAQHGLHVTVLEAQSRVMSRSAGTEVAAFYEREHRAAGVGFAFGSAVRAFHGTGRVAEVETEDGTRLPCDLAIVGVGIEPNVELAAEAGLDCDNGVVVDDLARTGDPHVVAAGDCTNLPLPDSGRRVRLESVANAIHQAKVAAATLTGSPTPYSEVPWFWSDQYDLKLQIAGLSFGHDRVELRGDPAKRSFAAYYFAGDRWLAVEAVNSPRDFMLARKLLGAGKRVPPDRVADPAADLEALAF